jgi:hypothetical protein
MNENKGQNHIPIDQNFWRTIGLISGDEHLLYVFKKSERIVTALYLVTNLIKDNDPLKWEIRERCMSLISSTIALASADSPEKNSCLRFFLSALLESRTFINISLGSHLISKMNAEILIAEIDALVIHIKERTLEDAARAGYVLSKSFFMTESPSKTDDKGQTEKASTGGLAQNSQKIKSEMSFKKGIENVDFQKDSRKNSIIEILKKQSNLTIKDIALIIPGYSTKTIQRELLDLVKAGIVKKEGDRRWSRYSLK